MANTTVSIYDIYNHLKVHAKSEIKKNYNIENEDHYVLYITTKLIASIDNSLWIYDDEIMKSYTKEEKEEVVISMKLEIIVYCFLLAAHYGIYSYDLTMPAHHEISDIYTLDICGIVLNSIKNKNNKDVIPYITKYLLNLIHDLKLDENSFEFAKKLDEYVKDKSY